MRKFILLLVLLIFLSACNDGNPKAVNLTTDTNSETIADKDERVEFLTKYLTPKSEIDDTQFHIFYQDNSSSDDKRFGVPGPSDWDIKAVVKLKDSSSTYKWVDGWEESNDVDLDDWKEIKLDDTWVTGNEPKAYIQGPKRVVLYEAEGIIYFRY